MSSTTTQIASQIKDAVVAALGQAGWQAFSDQQRVLIEECALDAAELQIAALAAAADPAATAAIQHEKTQITAQLTNIAAAEAARATEAFWDAAAKGLIKAAALLAA